MATKKPSVSGKATIRAAGKSAEVDATYDPETGVTDLDADSLNQTLAQLQPDIEQQQREDDAFLQAFSEIADSGEEITGISQFINQVEQRREQLLDDDDD